jgi:hypothetical protein
VVWEDLGKTNIAGIDTVGTRETTTTEPGTMGNDQPLTYVSEYWHSDQLGINLLSIRTSPFSESKRSPSLRSLLPIQTRNSSRCQLASRSMIREKTQGFRINRAL